MQNTKHQTVLHTGSFRGWGLYLESEKGLLRQPLFFKLEIDFIFALCHGKMGNRLGILGEDNSDF